MHLWKTTGNMLKTAPLSNLGGSQCGTLVVLSFSRSFSSEIIITNSSYSVTFYLYLWSWYFYGNIVLKSVGTNSLQSPSCFGFWIDYSDCSKFSDLGHNVQLCNCSMISTSDYQSPSPRTTGMPNQVNIVTSTLLLQPFSGKRIHFLSWIP